MYFSTYWRNSIVSNAEPSTLLVGAHSFLSLRVRRSAFALFYMIVQCTSTVYRLLCPETQSSILGMAPFISRPPPQKSPVGGRLTSSSARVQPGHSFHITSNLPIKMSLECTTILPTCYYSRMECLTSQNLALAPQKKHVQLV